MKLGVYGGTFNPVHCGHVRLARRYMEAAALDKLLVVPARIPPHKEAPDLIAGEDRMEMCRLAFAGLPGYEVSDLELRRPDKSYTVDTLEQLRMLYPEDALCLLMGSDMFLTITQWKDWRRIFQLSALCVGARESDLYERLEEEKGRLETLGARCEIVRLEPMVISSTEIRERVSRGEPVEGLVPAKVRKYIVDHGLYR